MRPSPKLSRFLSLIAATVVGNVCSSWGATQVCSTSLDAVAITRDLDSLRPAPVGSDKRAANLRELPRQGRIQHLDVEDTAKLHEISNVLRQHDRESVYTVVVVDLAEARVGLYDKSIVMVTLSAIRLLSADSHRKRSVISRESDRRFHPKAISVFTESDQRFHGNPINQSAT